MISLWPVAVLSIVSNGPAGLKLLQVSSDAFDNLPGALETVEANQLDHQLLLELTFVKTSSQKVLLLHFSLRLLLIFK